MLSPDETGAGYCRQDRSTAVRRLDAPLDDLREKLFSRGRDDDGIDQ